MGPPLPLPLLPLALVPLVSALMPLLAPPVTLPLPLPLLPVPFPLPVELEPEPKPRPVPPQDAFSMMLALKSVGYEARLASAEKPGAAVEEGEYSSVDREAERGTPGTELSDETPLLLPLPLVALPLLPLVPLPLLPPLLLPLPLPLLPLPCVPSRGADSVSSFAPFGMRSWLEADAGAAAIVHTEPDADSFTLVWTPLTTPLLPVPLLPLLPLLLRPSAA